MTYFGDNNNGEIPNMRTQLEVYDDRFMKTGAFDIYIPVKQASILLKKYSFSYMPKPYFIHNHNEI